MPKKAKGAHGRFETAGPDNLPQSYVEKNKDQDGTMGKILPVYHIGQKNRENYKGVWGEDDLRKAIADFFAYCESVDLKPAKVGLSLYLGINQDTYNEWQNHPEKFTFKTELIRQANEAIAWSYMSRTEKYPTGNIFLLKAIHGVVETNKVEITNTAGSNVDEIKDTISKLGLDKD